MALISLYILFFAFSLGQIGTVFNISSGKIYVFDLILLFFTMFWFLKLYLKKYVFSINTSGFLLFIFVLVTFLSLFFSIRFFEVSTLLVGLLYFLRHLLYVFGAYIYYCLFKEKELSFSKFRNAIIYSAVFMSVLGFIQLLILPDFTALDYSLGWDPHKNRMASTFFDPNFLSVFFVISLAFLIDKFQRKESTRSDTFLFLLILVSLFLTFSRSGWGMMSLFIMIYFWFKNKKVILLAFFIVFLTYFSVPRIQTRISGITDPADSASLRVVSWKNALKIHKSAPWFGVGFNNYRMVQKEYGYLTFQNENIHSGGGTDSSLFFVLSTTGLVGLISYISVFVYIVTRAIKQKEILVAALLVSLLAQSFFINSLFYPQIMFILYYTVFNFSVSDM